MFKRGTLKNVGVKKIINGLNRQNLALMGVTAAVTWFATITYVRVQRALMFRRIEAVTKSMRDAAQSDHDNMNN
jgi:hypothetical protein